MIFDLALKKHNIVHEFTDAIKKDSEKYVKELEAINEELKKKRENLKKTKSKLTRLKDKKKEKSSNAFTEADRFESESDPSGTTKTNEVGKQYVESKIIHSLLLYPTWGSRTFFVSLGGVDWV